MQTYTQNTMCARCEHIDDENYTNNSQKSMSQ